MEGQRVDSVSSGILPLWSTLTPNPFRSQEFLHYLPTVACLQEVDRLEYHGPIFRDAGYDSAYQKGYAAKLHGLCIAWKADIFEKAAKKFVKLDDATFETREETLSNESTRVSKRTACSRVTRNLGLFVALKFKQARENSQPAGIIVTTRKHHSFGRKCIGQADEC